MTKIAIAITDGNPDGPTVTAVLLLDESDYPAYEEATRRCYEKRIEDFPELLYDVIEELNKTGLEFEVIKDIKEEMGYFHFVD